MLERGHRRVAAEEDDRHLAGLRRLDDRLDGLHVDGVDYEGLGLVGDHRRDLIVLGLLLVLGVHHRDDSFAGGLVLEGAPRGRDETVVDAVESYADPRLA